MLKKVSLFQKKSDFFYFFAITFFITLISLGIEFYHYKQLTKFDSALINATVQKQYEKSKLTKTGKTKTYQVLKLKSDLGFSFYTTASKNLENILFQKIEVEAWMGEISFYEYMSSFYARSSILHVYPKESAKEKLNSFIASQHIDENTTALYQALFSAKQVDRELQSVFSNLGISHLIAISGFHLGVLSAVLFFLFAHPYKFLQNRYFPYRSYKLDSFIFISLTLLCYLLFLDSPPSLVRALGMLVVGFVLYDRGIEILSMQTLLLTVILILSFFIRFYFNIGFWLSVSGVFYIFLFLIHFKHLNKLWQFILIPFWVYLLMLPYSLVVFGNFSLYHPLSILWTTLFTLFYPLSILLHIFNFGNLLDGFLNDLINMNVNAVTVSISVNWLLGYILLSILAIYRKEFLYLLFLSALFYFIYAINYVT